MLEGQEESVVANLASHALSYGDHPAGQNLGRAAGVVVLHRLAGQRLDPEPLEPCSQRGESFRGVESAVEARLDHPRLQPLADPQQLGLADDHPEGATHLVVAAEIAETGAQKYVPSRTRDSLGNPEAK